MRVPRPSKLVGFGIASLGVFHFGCASPVVLATSPDAATGSSASSSSSIGSSGSSSSSGLTGADASHPTDASASSLADTAVPSDSEGGAPAVGSPGCEAVPCILCADGNYHCHSSVFPPCSAGVSTSTNCTSYNLPSYGCFYCPNDGNGSLFQCMDGGWDLSPFDCTP